MAFMIRSDDSTGAELLHELFSRIKEHLRIYGVYLTTVQHNYPHVSKSTHK